MKISVRGALATFALLVTFSPIAAAQDDASASRASAGTPRIKFETSEIQFGRILDDKTVYGEVCFTNTGDTTLTIKTMSSTCGCTMPTIKGVKASEGKTAMVNQTFAPGERACIEVGFRPIGKKGDQEQKVTITTDDPENQTIVLLVKAFVQPIVDVTPPTLLMGQVQRWESKTWTIAVTGYAKDFRVTRMTSGGLDSIKTKVLSTEKIDTEFGPAQRSMVEVTYVGGAPPGDLAAYALIRTTDQVRKYTGVQIQGKISGDLTIDKPSIRMGDIDVGTDNPFTFRVTNSQGKAFTVKNLRLTRGTTRVALGASEWTATEVPGSNGSAWDISATVKAIAEPGQFADVFSVASDIVGEPEVEVRVYGRAR